MTSPRAGRGLFRWCFDLDDPAGARRLDTAAHEAATRAADQVVLPKLASCGTQLSDAVQAPAHSKPLDAFVAWQQEASGQLQMVVVSGLTETFSGQVFNSAVIVDPGQLASV